jgi:hypothetical protein
MKTFAYSITFEKVIVRFYFWSDYLTNNLTKIVTKNWNRIPHVPIPIPAPANPIVAAPAPIHFAACSNINTRLNVLTLRALKPKQAFQSILYRRLAIKQNG